MMVRLSHGRQRVATSSQLFYEQFTPFSGKTTTNVATAAAFLQRNRSGGGIDLFRHIALLLGLFASPPSLTAAAPQLAEMVGSVLLSIRGTAGLSHVDEVVSAEALFEGRRTFLACFRGKVFVVKTSSGHGYLGRDATVACDEEQGSKRYLLPE